MTTTTPFRDVPGWLASGVHIQTTNNDAARKFDQSIRELYSWQGNPIASAKQALELDPSFILPKVFLIGVELLSTSVVAGNAPSVDQLLKKLDQELQNRQDLSVYDRLHILAIQQLAKGDMRAANVFWERILVSHPTDPVAIRFLNDSLFFLGDSRFIKDVVGSVLPKWHTNDPNYSFVLGMFAFGLEEAGFYRKAEENATKALSLCKTDVWSTHALAHVYEMEGRFTEGENFLVSTEEDWKQGKSLACHLWWHKALYLIEQNRHDEALQIFDEHMGIIDETSILDLVDMSALLFRLQMEGMEVDGRWGHVWTKWKPHIQGHLTAFNDAHIAMCLLGAAPFDVDANDFLSSAKAFFFHGTTATIDDSSPSQIASFSPVSFEFTPSFAQKQLSDEVGRACVLAIAYFHRKQYEKVVEVLVPVRRSFERIGGSHAQRDLFHQLLIQACLRSGEAVHFSLAHRLLTERQFQRESSPLTKRLLEQLKNRANLE